MCPSAFHVLCYPFALALLLLGTPVTGAFELADVEQIASRMASEPHVPPKKVGPEFLNLDYDSYRLIAQRHERALWRDLNLDTWVEFFPAGFLFEYPVKVHVVEEDGVRDIDYSDRWFQFRGDAQRLAEAEGGGFAGLRLMSLLPGNEHKTEYVSFLGASYFRGIGSGQWYGASARGLALDIGLGKPEEFPRFLEFWIERPDQGAEGCPQRMWALLESPGVAGAYEFCIRPGENTKISVQARVWKRHGIQKLALAPITSMWMWDAKTQPADDPRPEVHDSDGLLIHRNHDEWVWRPLRRPEKPEVEAWEAANLYGFGLMQRERDPVNYQDDEARYHLRPNVWVEAGARHPWGPGRVELLELPAKHEGEDNIGAYFVIDQEATDFGESIAFAYDLTFGTSMPWGHQVAPVMGSQFQQSAGIFTVKFNLPAGDLAASEVIAAADATSGRISSVVANRLDEQTVEVSVRYQPTRKSQEARVQIWLEDESEQEKISEVLSYRWTPDTENLQLANQ